MGQPLAPVTLIESVEQITLTTYLSLRPFCTRDSAWQPRDAAVSNGPLGYDEPSQLFTPDSKPSHGDGNSLGGSGIVTHRHC